MPSSWSSAGFSERGLISSKFDITGVSSGSTGRA